MGNQEVAHIKKQAKEIKSLMELLEPFAKLALASKNPFHKSESVIVDRTHIDAVGKYFKDRQ